MIEDNLPAVNVSASSHVTSRQSPSSLIIGEVTRSGASINPNAYLPLTQRCPRFTGASFAGRTWITLSSRTPTSISHPVPQYGHVVFVQLVGNPSTTDLSCNAPLGHTSEQAPHDTHALSPKAPYESGTTYVSSPRPAICQTNCPWTSSQIRTHA